MVTFTLFIGNPGAGKSTLGNAILGGVRFRSGMSFGGGLTSCFQMEKLRDGNYVGDCPGLDDPMIREQAAKEITKSLKSSEGDYKLVFVVTLESGRVRKADVTTFTLVLNAIKKEIMQPRFGVIINKLSSRMMMLLGDQTSTEFLKVMTSLNIGDYKTIHVLPYGRRDELEDQENALHEPTRNLMAFLEELPTVYLEPDMVEEVKANEFDEMKDEFTKKMNELKEDKKKMEERLAKQAAEFKKQIEEDKKNLMAEYEKRMQEEQKKLKGEMSGEMAEQMKNIEEQYKKKIDSLNGEMKKLEGKKGGGCNIL